MPRKVKAIALICSCLLLLYAWAGFLLLPAVGLRLINQQLAHYSTEPARLERLEFNPFTLQLDAWHLRIGEQEETLAFRSLHLQLAWDSIWQRKLHLNGFSIEEPLIRLDINKLGELNLLQLFNLPPQPAEQNGADSQTADTELPVVQVDLLQISNGQLLFADQRPAEPVAINIKQLDFELINLNTAPDEQGRLQLGLQIPDGTSINWRGELLLNPLSTHGQLELTQAALKTWWPYARQFTSLELQDGKFSSSLNYRLQLADDGMQLQLDDLQAKLEQLDIQLEQQPLLNLEHLTVSGSSLDLAAQQIHIGQISSKGLNTSLHIDQQGQLNWLHAFASSTATTNDSAGQPPAPFNGTGLADLDWQLKLDRLQLQDYQLRFTDQSHADPVQLSLTDLALSVQDLDSRSQQPLTLQLNSKLGEQGLVDLAASINPQTLAGQARLASENIDLRPAQAWISPYARARLLSAMLGSELQLQLASIAPLQLEVDGQLTISQLHIQDAAKNRDLLKWSKLSLEQIQLKQDEQTRLQIGQIIARQPYVRLIIDEQLQTNIAQILVEQAPAAQPETATTAQPHLQLGKILIEDGAAHFSDLSLTPNFVTRLQDLHGEIGSLDNQRNLQTAIQIKGAVDRQAPVVIEGSLTPFDPMQQLDIQTSFKHMDLTTLTPYSGKFVGYRIHKGKLNLDLHYQVQQGQLNASNSVLLEQLQLGQKVKSEDAVNLPVRLAIALLKNNRGDIELELPVQGDLNNPEFSVMPIVWQTLRNLVTRAVSAPFKMLGSLVSSKQDLDKVDFAPGSSELSQASQQSLHSLAQALQRRPLLKLSIEATSSASFDGQALAGRFLQLRIKQLWYEDLQRRGKVLPEDLASLEVPPRQQDKLLAQLYAELAAEQQTPEPEGNKEQKLQAMQQQLIDAYADNQTRLRLLAQQRGKNIRDFLIEQGELDPQRIFLLDVDENASANDEVIASILHLDA